jgi:hypothetical protein
MFSLALALLAGCSPSGPAGIWLIQVKYDADAGVECATNIEENFTDGYVPGDDSAPTESEWTYEQSTTGSDSLLFAQIETTAAGEGVLLIGGDVLPGTAAGGAWSFAWTDESGTEDAAEHESGYRYTERTGSASEIAIELTLTGETASGVLVASSDESMRWTETDEYGDGAENYVGTSGQMPSDEYLVYNERGDEYSQQNGYEDDDCEGSTCELTVTSSCEGTNTFTATRTDYQDEDAYSYLQTY